MITFDINGANVEFGEKQENYNAIRKSFKEYALEISDCFFEDCLDSMRSLKQVSENGLSKGEKYINEALKKGVETIVSYNVVTVDINIFREVYCEKYLDYKRLFNNLNKAYLVPNKNKKNNHINLYDIKSTIEKLRDYIYDDCFNIHFAVIDALIENGVTRVGSYVDDESIKKSNALFNNYKDGFINKPYDCNVVKQIILLNPYREDVYEFFVKEDGDFNKEIERLTDFLGYDIKPCKEKLMDLYTSEIIKNPVVDIEFEKEKIEKYAKYIGYDEVNIYTARIDAIYTFQNA